MPRKTQHGSSLGQLAASSFNEAAARCRGKLSGASFVSGRQVIRFNEAAARCRGKRSPAGPAFRAARSLQ